MLSVSILFEYLFYLNMYLFEFVRPEGRSQGEVAPLTLLLEIGRGARPPYNFVIGRCGAAAPHQTVPY